MAGWLPAWKTPVNFASSSNKEQAKESLPAALPRAVTSLQPCPQLSASIPHCPALHQSSMLSTQGRASLVIDLRSNSDLKYFPFLCVWGGGVLFGGRGEEISQFCYLKPVLDKYFSDSPLSPLKAFLNRKQFPFSSQPKRTTSSLQFDWIWQWKYHSCSSDLAVKSKNHSPEIKIKEPGEEGVLKWPQSDLSFPDL